MIMNTLGGIDSSEKSGHVPVNMVVSEESHTVLENVDTHVRLTAHGKPRSGFWSGNWKKGRKSGAMIKEVYLEYMGSKTKQKIETTYQVHLFKFIIYTITM